MSDNKESINQSQQPQVSTNSQNQQKEEEKNKSNIESTDDSKKKTQNSEKDEKIPKEIKETEPIKFQLISKMDIVNMEQSEKISSNSKEDEFGYMEQIQQIITIKEISNNNIGILYDNNTLSIYNTNTFKKINTIKFVIPEPKEEKENKNDYSYERDRKEIVYNFIVLKNHDLVFWTLKRIFIYKLSEKEHEYKLYQTIDESMEKSEPDDHFSFHSYRKYYSRNDCTINSVYELNNGNLITCKTNCIKFYSKNSENENYTLLSKVNTDVEVNDLIEIKPNKLFLLQKDYESGGFCSQTYYCIHTYALSFYDMETNKLTKINKFQKEVSLKYNDMKYFKNDKYLFIQYGWFKFDIFDINDNLQSINKNNEIIGIETIKEYYNFFRERTYDIINREMLIVFLCHYTDDLFFAKDSNGEIKVYQFKDKSYQLYQKFPLASKDIRGMIKLKNNKIIMFSPKELSIFDGSK